MSIYPFIALLLTVWCVALTICFVNFYIQFKVFLKTNDDVIFKDVPREAVAKEPDDDFLFHDEVI